MKYLLSFLIVLSICVPCFGNEDFVLDLETTFVPDHSTVFSGQNEDDEWVEILRIECNTGDIYWRDQLVTTNNELVEGLYDIINNFPCPECQGKRIK